MPDLSGLTVPLSNGGSVTIAPNPLQANQLQITVVGTDLGANPGDVGYGVVAVAGATVIISEADAISSALTAVISNIGGP